MSEQQQPTPWPVDKIERRPVSALAPYARNAKLHTPEQVEQIAAAIREWGWTNPVLIDPDGEIIAGHGRVLAAQLLGIAHVPVIIAEGWTVEQKRAYAIADNRIGENGGWDSKLLALELSDLKGLGFDMSLIGFSADDLDAMLTGGAERREAAVGSLKAAFGIPPFSVLSARDGWWQSRKAAWLGLGLRSEIGRGDNLLKFSDTMLAAARGDNPATTRAAP